MDVGGYTLLSRLGEGGMGVVHLARRDGGERVALKVLRQHIVGDDEARARLAREVSSLSRIRSRWVAEIVDADPWAAVPYVATRYVPGLSLHDHVVEEGPIQGEDLVWFAACLAEGVASIHEVGVLHRDVKPSNVLMEGRTPIVIDFGLARVADDPRLTHTGWLLGTPGYLAPEILYGDDATTASDVHSWAATVAYAGTGRAPFGRGPSMAIMDRVRRGEHDLSGLHGDLARVVEAALDPDPARRPRLDQVLAWLRPQTTRPDLPQPVLEHTVPLAALHHDARERTTEHLGAAPAPGRPETRVLPTRFDPMPDPMSDPGTRPLWDQHDPWAGDGSSAPVPEPVPVLERLRRGVLLVATALLVGAGIAAYPWPVLTLVCLVVWILRSGSLAASAAGDRRRLRGRRWYDGAQFLLGAPWDLVRSIPATLMLITWSVGLAAAGALLCYAVAAGLTLTLVVSGLVLSLSLWAGPGGSRVRSPLARAVHPLSREPGRWFAAVAAVVLLSGLAALAVRTEGTSWTPWQERPLSGQRLTVGH
ncbi:unannotated protein [freshwater metagenome]|uniref:Unannotated protein n=1 Tax=freshwater metagenome TaxID=449393 RepID=A0A6J6Q3L7_9ZZZZ